MSGDLFVEGIGLLIAAAAAPLLPTHTVTLADAVPSQSEAVAGTPATAAQRARTRDERIGAVALRGFPSAEIWTPPAKSWGDQAYGPVLEVGALGARRSNQPDLAHVTIDWQF
ncbi:hypothetical protein [Novosphingobium sp.]|uniref:hypothetical protein n=1 Tax=Novosphingobium sp. TaxID=1874826 RepID=UPI0025D9F201|nr:hypothetical protein [Novosphingobium sp.]